MTLTQNTDGLLLAERFEQEDDPVMPWKMECFAWYGNVKKKWSYSILLNDTSWFLVYI